MESFTTMACRAHRAIAFEDHHSFHSTKLRRKSWSVIKSFARQKKSVNILKRGLKLNPERSQQNSGTTSLDGFKTSEKGSDSINEYNNGVLRNPTRNAVLRACTVTSGLLLALGLAIRQLRMDGRSLTALWYHVYVSLLGVSLVLVVGFVDFQMWRLELIAAPVMVISSSRYLLLQIWPDFAESSQAANQQVLSSLQPLDYLVVAFLPGVSEELLFRGALLPLFGLDLKSCALVAAFFGILHIGGGRKASFAIWATFVGFAYGYATILSSSLIVPMASHGLNNLVGALMWRYLSTSSVEQ